MRYIKFIIIIIIMLMSVSDLYREVIKLESSKRSVQYLKDEIQKKEKLELQDNNMKRMSNIINKEKSIDDLLLLIDSNGLSLNFISVSDSVVDAVLFGSADQLKKFFQQMTTECSPFLIQYSELSQQGGSFRLKFKLTLLSYCVRPTGSHVIFSNLNSQKNLEDIFLYSIKQIKFVGFFKYPEHWVAVIMLPNRESKDVVVGDLLGVEHAKVVRIDEENILVKSNGMSVSIKKQ